MSKKSHSKRNKKNQYRLRSKVETTVTSNKETESSAKLSLKKGETVSNRIIFPDKGIKYSKYESTNANLIQRIGSQIKNHPLIAIIIFAIGMVSFLMTAYQIYMYHYDKVREPSIGLISGQIIDERQPLFIKLGGNPVTTSIDNLKRGFNLKQFLTIDGLSIPVKVYNENNRLLFDVDIYDSEGRNICSVVRNEWKFYPNGIYDKNSNSNAFEIVDSEQFPIFQIEFKEFNQVEVGGYSISPNGLYNIYTSKQVLVGIDKDVAKTKIERIFKYPSSNYQGMTEKNLNNK